MTCTTSSQFAALVYGIRRAAVAFGVLGALVLLSACSDDTSKSITAPSSIRAINTSSGTFGNGNGNSARVIVCVDASSPAGIYKFRNSSWNSGLALTGYGVLDNGVWYDQGDGGEGAGAAGGTRVFSPAEGDGSEYVVGVGQCVTVLTRTTPADAYWVTSIDNWQAVNVTASSWPTGVTYDHSDCELDPGVITPQPNPCGADNITTRAFANWNHGTKITYVFKAPVASTGRIMPTSTGCEDYMKNTAAPLTEILATFKGSSIVSTAPGVFFYYAKVTKGAGQSVAVTQSVNPNAGGLPQYIVQQTQAYLYTYNGSKCAIAATLTVGSNGTTASGGASLPAGNYVLGLKFATDSPKGVVVSNAALRVSGALLATYHYGLTVGGSADASTTASVDTKTK